MSRYNPYYYLLFVLLIFGAFASMAQNDYGIKILGGAAFVFGLLFLIQLMGELRSKHKTEVVTVAELLGLTVIAVILSMRVFYIRFPLVEAVFGLAGLILLAAYSLRLFRTWQNLQSKNRALAILLVMFHGSILCYVASMTFVPFIPALAEPLGGAGLLLLLLFLVMGWLKREMLVEGEKLSAFTFVSRVRDRSIVLIALFLLFTAYMGLTKIDFIPKMYSDEFPQKYFELVNQAESGEEKPVDGKYKHEEFKEMYDKFIERHVSSDKK
ncbi:MAG: hypothetical protein KF725_06690 [Cyclobacteriaceae bacterium]|nr:hypothetical protein [Cyclobacteriaceae bacterium]UYN88384.1 MAG: hypothetical protein KIT51_09120 [Cyclobacteriaceae bacterium]